MAIKHKKDALRPDNSDPSEVQPSDWNDDHTADGVVGEFLNLSVAPDTIPYINATGDAALLSVVTPAKTFLAGPTTAAMLAAIGAVGLDSPVFVNNPRAPTPPTTDNDTSIATTAFVQAVIAALVASSPAALNTLNELAVAIGNDPNFSATLTTALGNRLRVDAAQSLTTPQKTQGKSNLGLGTAASLDVGVGPSLVVQLDGAGKLPVVDGSQLTNLPNGAAGPGYGGTSATSLTPATGSKAFTTQTGMAYQTGSRARATSQSNPAVWMEGVIASYAGGVLTINVDLIGTATAKADWNLSLTGERGSQGTAGTNGTNGTDGTNGAAGAQGPQGAAGAQGPQGAAGAQGPQGVQGPAGTFPIGAGVVGGYAMLPVGTTPSSVGFGGSWLTISNGTNDTLYQRYA